MNGQRFFTRKLPAAGEPGTPIPWRKILTTAGIVVIFFALGVFVSLRTERDWKEVAFALQKPNLVKIVRLRYEQKQANLDKDVLQDNTAGQEAQLKAIEKKVEELQGFQKQQQSFR